MSLLAESRITLKLAVPLMIGQLSQMLMGVADTVMIGHLGVTPLAALTFANSLFYVPFVFGIGVLTSVSVATSNARGAGDAAAARASCRHGLYLGTSLGIVLFLITFLMSLHLDWFGQPPEVACQTSGFFRILMASSIPALASIALKNHADALNRPWIPFWIFLGGVLLNIVLNWIMIFGRLGCPTLGFEGAAWATLIARCAILIAMILWLVRSNDLRDWVPHHWIRKAKVIHLKHLLGLGIPASLQMLCEVSAFSIAGLLMGRLNADAMAAHQITISLTGSAFMIPLGFSMALTVRMGEAYGAGNRAQMRRVAYSGWLMLILIAGANATCFLSLGHQLAACFTHAQGVVDLTAAMLAICAAFQIFDALQVGSASMLRGMHDTRVPALTGFLAYWVVGIPLGAWLAFSNGLGARGVWWGLAAGLAVASGLMGLRLASKLRHPADG